MKKDKNWMRFPVETEVKSNGVHEPQPPRCSSKTTKTADLPVVQNRNFNFHRYLGPKLVPDLAVHPKKITEVESWLKNNVCNIDKTSQTAKFLLISGPTGSGKTATVQVLCKSMDIGLSEWLNPADQDFEVFRGPNQVTRFVEFLTESKWNSLVSSGGKKIILVEDFPNALVRNPDEFGAVLEECYYKGNYPIVFICTDSADSRTNLADKLFAQDVRNKYKIIEISFNACASTLLKQALRRAHNLVQDNLDLFKTPTPTTVNAIMTSSMGDIKCAMNQYYFAALLGTSDLPTVSNKIPQKSKPTTKRKRADATSSVRAMSRDENLGLFHAVGRVLNPKRIEHGATWRLHCDLGKLIDEFGTQPGAFTGFLFENYVKYFGDLDDFGRAAEDLSLSQTFLEKWVDRGDVLTFALWVSTMGLMVHNEHKVTGWNPITGPKRVQKRKIIDGQKKNPQVTDVYYYNIINNIENSGFRVN